MPLYAYINIPGFSDSESSDDKYGASWIPINTLSLGGRTLQEDQTLADTQKKQEEAAADARKANREKTLDSRQKKYTGEQMKTARAALAKQREKEAAGKEYTKDPDDDIFGSDILTHMLADKHSGGKITIEKMLDSNSPKLHQLCLECQQYESEEYIEGQLEIHICRHIPGQSGAESARETYMAYILKNCLLTELSFDASDNKITETLTITFEEIHSCVKNTAGTWDTGSWNFTDEDTTQSINPTEL